MRREIVGSMSEWSGALKDLLRQIDDGSLALPQMQAFVEHRNPFGSDFPNIDCWGKVYSELGMMVEFEKTFPNLDARDDLWVVPVLQGVTCDKVVVVLRRLGVDVYTYTSDLDAGVPTNDRDPEKRSYVVGFVRAVEADEANKNLSANALKERGHEGITLLERLLLELGYFLATNQHLDAKNATLCAGSRDSGGGVPSVDWSAGRRGVSVHWCRPGNACGFLRSRSVVSLPAKQA